MNANESNEQVLAALQEEPSHPYVLVAYRLSDGRVRIVNMAYVLGVIDAKPTKKQAKEMFRYGCMRVNDNLLTGHAGFVRDADGTVYRVSRESKTAEKVNI